MEIYTDILCTNYVQKILNSILFIEVIFSGDLQHVVEAGTGIEPVYTDLQLITSNRRNVLQWVIVRIIPCVQICVQTGIS